MELLKKSLICAFALASAGMLSALETGGLVTNDTTFANEEKDGSLKLNQKNGASLWLRAPLSEDGSSYFSAEGSFTSEYIASEEDSDKKLKLTLDATLFKLVLQKQLDSAEINFSAGRFYNSDLTGIIYTQNGDGAKIEAAFPRFEITAFGAYTGLLNAKNVTIIDFPESSELTTDLTDKEKTLYVTAKKFVVGSLTFTLPNIFANQTIAMEGLGAFSLESTKYNRVYGTLALTGPIVSPMFYNLSSSIGMFKYEDSDWEKSNLTTASISVYPDFKSMSLSLNGLYASGSQGSFKPFQGFTSGTAVSSLLEPEYTALAKAGLSASIKPVQNVLLAASGDIVFDAAAGDEGNKIEQAGFEYSVSVNIQALSDVSLGAGLTQYIGKEDYEGTIGASKTQIKISAAIAF
ncbi:MAG: hypothetical protein IJ207_11285 [Treponema sp.]|uniref:hypothetical protein n=1 Tax=Treponema sp. TaxID=166 RepID=UPI0025FAFDDC|nr:hypothetical protein [Treponema sp.]MBQ9282757.1 hypothetical protein [Treponema sp.]